MNIRSPAGSEMMVQCMFHLRVGVFSISLRRISALVGDTLAEEPEQGVCHTAFVNKR